MSMVSSATTATPAGNSKRKFKSESRLSVMRMAIEDGKFDVEELAKNLNEINGNSSGKIYTGYMMPTMIRQGCKQNAKSNTVEDSDVAATLEKYKFVMDSKFALGLALKSKAISQAKILPITILVIGELFGTVQNFVSLCDFVSNTKNVRFAITYTDDDNIITSSSTFLKDLEKSESLIGKTKVVNVVVHSSVIKNAHLALVRLSGFTDSAQYAKISYDDDEFLYKVAIDKIASNNKTQVTSMSMYPLYSHCTDKMKLNQIKAYLNNYQNYEAILATINAFVPKLKPGKALMKETSDQPVYCVKISGLYKGSSMEMGSGEIIYKSDGLIIDCFKGVVEPWVNRLSAVTSGLVATPVLVSRAEMETQKGTYYYEDIDGRMKWKVARPQTKSKSSEPKRVKTLGFADEAMDVDANVWQQPPVAVEITEDATMWN